MHYSGTCFVSLLLPLLAVSASAQDKPNFTGTWQIVEAKSSMKSGQPCPVKITIDQKAGSSIHLTRVVKEGDKEVATEFTCSMDGKDCEVAGTKVSLWFSGPSLVEMDMGKDVTTKTTMKLEADHKSITLDVSHVSPSAEDDELVFAKN